MASTSESIISLFVFANISYLQKAEIYQNLHAPMTVLLTHIRKFIQKHLYTCKKVKENYF